MVEPLQQLINFKYILAAFVFSAVGIIILGLSCLLFDKLTPGRLWTEIVNEKNMPLAITTAAMILAMAQIIAAAIHS